MKNFAKMTKAELISEIHNLLKSAESKDNVIASDVGEEYEQRKFEFCSDPYDSAPFGYITFNHSGTIKEINQTAARMFGKERDLLIGSSFKNIISERYLENFNQHLRHCKETGQAISEMYLKPHESDEFIAHVCSVQYMDFTKQQILYRTTISDISKLKSEEEARQKNQKLLQAVIEGTSDAIYAKDLSGHYLLFNSSAATATGKDPKDVIGKDDFFLYPAREAKKVIERDRAIMLAGRSMTFEETVPGAVAGEWITYNTTKGPLFDEQGKIIGQFGIARNITEQKRAELLLQESRQRLKESEDRLRLATQLAGMGTFDYYPQSGKLILSDLSKTHFGIAPDTQISFDTFLAGIHPGDRQRIEELIKDVLHSQRIPEFKAEFLSIGVQDQKTRWLAVRGRTFFNDRGESVRFIGSILDITEAKKNEAEIERLASFPQLDPNPIIELDMTGSITYHNSAAAKFLKKIRGKTLDIFIPSNIDSILLAMRGEKKQFIVYQEIPIRDGYFGEYIHLVPHLQVIRIYATDITARKQAQKALQQSYAELELRVMERTTKLAGAVDALQKEISERKAAEEKLLRLNNLYAVLSAIDKAIVHTSSQEELFQEICRIAVENGRFKLAWIGVKDPIGGTMKVAASHGATDYLDGLRIPLGDEPEGRGPVRLVVSGQESCVICNDFIADPCTVPWQKRAEQHGLYATASIALKMNKEVVGALALYAGHRGFFDSQMIDLIQQTSAEISYALDNFYREERRKQAEIALQAEINERLRTMEELYQKDRIMMQQSRLASMGEMVGNIAHQWRQPLNTLGLIVQRLPFFYQTGDLNKEFLESSAAEAMNLIQHMSKTIDDFRGFFKTDKERIAFEADKVIHQTVSLFEGSVKDAHITMTIECPSNLVIHGYPNEYSQVVLCILHNARDVILERKLTQAQIRIRAFAENGKAVVTVADNAGGIAVDIMDKIFDPYFTTKSPDKGTGLGLFMAKKIIEESMAGKLLACNTDSGAEFRIEV